MNFQFIPDELKRMKNWVCWRSEPDPKAHSGIKKTPVNPYTGGNAMSNNPDTWSDFDTAVRASEKFGGIGFVFDGSGYFGVDLDDMKDDPDGIVKEFIDTLQSYSETSQSGNGIHIICKGKLPDGKRRKGKIEMYEKGRFFIMTGNMCAEYANISDCTESIKPLHEKYLSSGKNSKNHNDSGQLPISYISAPPDVTEIIRLAKSAANGEKFSKLYSGDFSGYNSQSEADMAFCNMLAFWCRGDIQKMDGIFRSSGLMRDKWDRKQSGSTYGMLTMQKAVSQCDAAYDPKNPANRNYEIFIGGSKSIRNKMYSFDDTGNALRMLDNFGQDLKFCYVDKEWLFWKNGKWHTDNIGYAERQTDHVLDVLNSEITFWQNHEGGSMLDDFMKHKKKSRSHSSKKAMIEELKHLVPVTPSDMDTHKALLNCKNGILNLKTGKLMPHDRNFIMTKICGTDYPENFKPPEKWLDFLYTIFGGGNELIRYIQKAIGYSLTGSTAEQCVFFLYGTGRNGKSTFLEIIRHIMGDYAVNIQPETIMTNRAGSGANSDVARLKGARLVTSAEPNEGVRLNEGLVKQMSGGDVITARKQYGSEFEFKPEFKLWMATNHKPLIRGTDTGIWRRIHIIPFTVTIPENKVDKSLTLKLRSEAPHILTWAAEGCIMWQKEGLRMPKAVLDAVKEYRNEMDTIGAFLGECCAVKQGESVKSSVLFAKYLQWAEDNNEHRFSNTAFGREISKRFDKVKHKDGLYYSGLCIPE